MAETIYYQEIPGVSARRYNRAWRKAAKGCSGPRTQPAKAPFRVYLILNKVTDAGYVGVTKRPILTRWGSHLERAFTTERKGQGSQLSKAIRKYGPRAFSIRVLSEALNAVVAHQLETFWIRELRTLDPRGYNMTEGGKAGFRWSRKTIVKMRRSQKARMADPAARERLRKARTRPQRQMAERKGRRARQWSALVKKFLTPVNAARMLGT